MCAGSRGSIAGQTTHTQAHIVAIANKGSSPPVHFPDASETGLTADPDWSTGTFLFAEGQEFGG